MSLQSYNTINSLNDPLKQFLAKFTITGNKFFPSTLADQVELRAQSFTWPTITADTTVVTWGGHERTYAGKQTRAGTWTVTFTEVYSGDILKGFRDWFNAFHNYTNGTIAIASEYQSDIEVALLNPELYDPQPKGVIATRMKLFRAWPMSISGTDINPSSSDPVDLTVEFHYDYFLIGDEIPGTK